MKSLILINKNDFSIYFVILSDFVNLKPGKILDVFVKLPWIFYRDF